jgi:hypothetical protein
MYLPLFVKTAAHFMAGPAEKPLSNDGLPGNGISYCFRHVRLPSTFHTGTAVNPGTAYIAMPASYFRLRRFEPDVFRTSGNDFGISRFTE